MHLLLPRGTLYSTPRTASQEQFSSTRNPKLPEKVSAVSAVYAHPTSASTRQVGRGCQVVSAALGHILEGALLALQGRGNNWAMGFGMCALDERPTVPLYQDALADGSSGGGLFSLATEAIRKEAERCDSLRAFVVPHSLGKRARSARS